MMKQVQAMRKGRRACLTTCVCCALAAAVIVTPGGSARAEGTHEIEGPWVMDSITVISSHGKAVYPDPQPGLFVFSGEHYSMVWSIAMEPTPDSEELWYPTEEEKARSFSSLIVNSGTYTVSDTLVTTYPMVAKTPEFVGGMATYRYRVVADTLWMEMTNTVSRGGVVDPGVGKVRLPLRLVRP